MSSELTVYNLRERIEKIKDVLDAATAGDENARINSKADDVFLKVESGIDNLLDKLLVELHDREKAKKQLEDQIATISHQQQTIVKQQDDLLELSSPVTKVWDNVLILPLIGTLDSRRAQIMMENLLQKIVETGCTMTILDITGVPTIDTQVANYLIKTVTATRLLGAECVISGISPAIAQTIVHLGIDLSAIRTKASMQAAMQYALGQNNQNGFFGEKGTKIPVGETE